MNMIFYVTDGNASIEIKKFGLDMDAANLLGNMNKNEEAIEQYKEYLAAYPDDADAYRNLDFIYKKVASP